METRNLTTKANNQTIYNIQNFGTVHINPAAETAKATDVPTPTPQQPLPKVSKRVVPWATIGNAVIFIGNVAMKVYDWWSKLGG